jgi:hypothetical protein
MNLVRASLCRATNRPKGVVIDGEISGQCDYSKSEFESVEITAILKSRLKSF